MSSDAQIQINKDELIFYDMLIADDKNDAFATNLISKGDFNFETLLLPII